MKAFKKNIKNSLLLLSTLLLTLLLSFNVNADDGGFSHGNIELSDACQNIFDTIEENVEEFNFEMAPSEQYWECIISNMGMTNLDMIFISFLGDGAKKPIALTHSFFSDGRYEDRVAELDAINFELPMSTNLSSLVTTFNHLINQILVVLAGLFFVFYLINTASDGSLFGDKYNAFWKIIRFVFVILMMAPIAALNNFSIMQAIVVVVAQVATISASVIWMMISSADAMYGTDIEKIAEKEKDIAYSQVSQSVDANIFLHACDIQKRKSIMLENLSARQMNSSVINDLEYKNCLYDDTIDGRVDNRIYSHYPYEIERTTICADRGRSLNLSGSCGYLRTSLGLSGGVILDDLGEPFQDDVRDVSEKLIALMCSKKIERSFGDSHVELGDSHRRTCAKYNKDFEYSANGIVDTYNVGEVTEEELLNDFQNLNNIVYSALNDEAKANAMGDVYGTIEQRMEIVISNSFLSAAGFIFENGKNYSRVRTNYGEYFSDYNVHYSKNIRDTFDTEEESEEYFLRNQSFNELNIQDAIERVAAQDEDESGLLRFITDNIFVGAQLISDFNNSDVEGLTEGCEDDFSLCSVASLNPINDIVKTGLDIAEAVTGLTLIFSGIEHFTGSYIDSKESIDSNLEATAFKIVVVTNAISGVIASILFVQVLIAYFMIFLLPLVIFVYFIGVVLNWIISVFEALVVINLWLLLHLLPTTEEGFAGQAKKGYTMLLHILVKPSFLILGLFVAFMMASIMVAFLNVSFGIVLGSFDIFQNPSSYLDLIYNVIIDVTYFVALLYVCFRAAKAIYKVPRSLVSWIGFEESSHSSFSENLDQYKQQLLVNIKRYLIIV